MTRFSKAVAYVVGIIFSFGLAISPVSAKEIRIGQIVALTGPAAPFGIPERDAVRYQVEKANAEGGINGYELVYFVEDDESNPTTAARAARKLILENKVDVIIGPTTGTMSFAVGPIAARHQVPFLAPQGTVTVTDKDTGFFDWIFRSSVTDKVTIVDAVDYMKDQGYKRIGLFFQEDAYGKAAATMFKELTDNSDAIELVGQASAQLSASNLSVHATRLLATNPDVIFVQSDSVSVGSAILRALHQNNSTVPVMVAGGMGMQAFIDAAGEAAEGVISIGSIGWDKPSAEQQRFMDGYGDPKGFSEALAGTGFLIVEAAAKTIEGEASGAKLRDAMEKLCGVPTLIGGEACYSPDDHDGGMSGVNLKVIDGKWVTISDQ